MPRLYTALLGLGQIHSGPRLSGYRLWVLRMSLRCSFFCFSRRANKDLVRAGLSRETLRVRRYVASDIKSENLLRLFSSEFLPPDRFWQECRFSTRIVCGG